jgi:hypothetical protein
MNDLSPTRSTPIESSSEEPKAIENEEEKHRKLRKNQKD